MPVGSVSAGRTCSPARRTRRSAGPACRSPGRDVVPARFTGVADHLLAANLEQDSRADRVEVPDVMGHELAVPLVGARLDVQGYHRLGIEIVARSDLAVEVGRGIPDHDEQRSRVGIDRRCHPRRAAAPLPRVLVLGEVRFFLGDRPVELLAFPGRLAPATLPALIGNRLEAPGALAVGGAVGIYEAAHSVLRPGVPHDDQALVGERRDRQAVAGRGPGAGGHPAEDLSGIEAAGAGRAPVRGCRRRDGRDRGPLRGR